MSLIPSYNRLFCVEFVCSLCLHGFPLGALVSPKSVQVRSANKGSSGSGMTHSTPSDLENAMDASQQHKAFSSSTLVGFKGRLGNNLSFYLVVTKEKWCCRVADWSCFHGCHTQLLLQQQYALFRFP